ncbi:hypothetical protein CJA_2288 [Cellvibrio japonicus Ueda107]|uniref:Uncharacterized protein n=1 Tax=Cellvibrio japonicus (strain Ueda107) TaxID=498211 RepID=B3PJS9_CELJU|nr:hypothetical protein CJA_2288 [Cellvibrio japonicus Ueda107]
MLLIFKQRALIQQQYNLCKLIIRIDFPPFFYWRVICFGGDLLC